MQELSKLGSDIQIPQHLKLGATPQNTINTISMVSMTPFNMKGPNLNCVQDPASMVYARATSKTYHTSLFLTTGANSQKKTFPSHYQIMIYIYDLSFSIQPRSS